MAGKGQLRSRDGRKALRQCRDQEWFRAEISRMNDVATASPRSTFSGPNWLETDARRPALPFPNPTRGGSDTARDRANPRGSRDVPPPGGAARSFLPFAAHAPPWLHVFFSPNLNDRHSPECGLHLGRSVGATCPRARPRLRRAHARHGGSAHQRRHLISRSPNVRRCGGGHRARKRL